MPLMPDGYACKYEEMGFMLQDDDIRLRPLIFPDDVEVALPWYADPEVLRFSEGEGTPPYNTAMVRAMYQWMVNNGCTLLSTWVANYPW